MAVPGWIEGPCGLRGRVARFVLTGATCAALQFTLVVLLEPRMAPLLANGLAFLVAAQLNFALSLRFTWGDRALRGRGVLVARWLSFLGSIVGTATLNMTVFALARTVTGEVAAAAAGIAVAAAVNFLVVDRAVLAAPAPRPGGDAVRAESLQRTRSTER